MKKPTVVKKSVLKAKAKEESKVKEAIHLYKLLFHPFDHVRQFMEKHL